MARTTEGPVAARVSWAQVLTWRMRRQGVLLRDCESPAEAAGRLAGVQAQLASAADHSVAARRRHPSRGETEAALWQDRSLLRTWAMRGTLHLLPAAEAPVWVAALGTRSLWRAAAWLRAADVTIAEVEALIAACAGALEGPPLTRDQLVDEICERTGSRRLAAALSQGWGSLLKPAASAGVLCSGPPRGRNVTFTRPDRWLSCWRDVDGQDACHQVLRWFLGRHGPASIADTARWWGVRSPVVRPWFAALEGELVEVEVDGFRGWLRSADAAELVATRPEPVIRLLPAFDSYVIVALTSEAAVAASIRADVSRTAGWISAVVLRGGRVIGVWETCAGRPPGLNVRLYESVSRTDRRRLDDELSRVQSYLGVPLEISVAEPEGPVSAPARRSRR